MCSHYQKVLGSSEGIVSQWVILLITEAFNVSMPLSNKIICRLYLSYWVIISLLKGADPGAQTSFARTHYKEDNRIMNSSQPTWIFAFARYSGICAKFVGSLLVEKSVKVACTKSL